MLTQHNAGVTRRDSGDCRPPMADGNPMRDNGSTVYSSPLVGQASAIPTGRSLSQFARLALSRSPSASPQCFPVGRFVFPVFGIDWTPADVAPREEYAS